MQVKLKALQILNSRGVPTLRIVAKYKDWVVKVDIPEGASKGKDEIEYLIDKDKAYNGKSVYKAIHLLNKEIFPKISSKLGDSNLKRIDDLVKELSPWGNIRLGLSILNAKLAAFKEGVPLYEIFSEFSQNQPKLPTPMFNLINGGKHAFNHLPFQEFMIVPAGINFYPKQLQAATEIFNTLKNILQEKDLFAGYGDEGGISPKFNEVEKALDYLMLAIEKSGYSPGEEILIALDVASSVFFADGKYLLQNRNTGTYTSEELISYLSSLSRKYPILSIEDGLSDTDWQNWPLLTNKLMENNILSVGDDLISTNPSNLKKAIDKNAISATIIKPNQVGTLTETLETIKLAQENGITCIASHRSGETCDPFIAHLAVGTYTSFIKAGAPNRGERVNKYNELLEIHYLYRVE